MRVTHKAATSAEHALVRQHPLTSKQLVDGPLRTLPPMFCAFSTRTIAQPKLGQTVQSGTADVNVMCFVGAGRFPKVYARSVRGPG